MNVVNNKNHNFKRIEKIFGIFGIRTSWLVALYNSKVYKFISQFNKLRRDKIRYIYRYYIDVRISNRMEKRWRKFVRLSKFANSTNNTSWIISDSVNVITPVPDVYPLHDKNVILPLRSSYVFPEVFVTRVNNGVILGGSNFIALEGEVICHDFYDFNLDYTSEEYNKRAWIEPLSERIRLLTHHDAQSEMIAVAGSFVDSCAANYAHWLTEVLPRIAIFCSDDRFKTVPIVINDGLHNNIMDSLLKLVGPDRKIIKVHDSKTLIVEELYITSPAGYTPYGQRSNDITNVVRSIFNPIAFDLIRKGLNVLDKNDADNALPKKIYVRRNSTYRNMTNNDEIEEFLTKIGFVIIEPEKMSFDKQVDIFHGAEVIIAPIGAALANIIFCKKTVKIFILVNKIIGGDYSYWRNLSNAAGVNICYILGNIQRGHNNTNHSDYSIDIENIRSALQSNGISYAEYSCNY